MISNTGLFRVEVAGGLIFAGNTFTGGWDDSFIQFGNSPETISWSTDDTMGVKDLTGKANVYIEDNTFFGGTKQAIDGGVVPPVNPEAPTLTIQIVIRARR